jgi:ketosteroid isomerase-like protein
MSQENVEVVRRCSEFFRSRDFSYLAQVVDPELVFDVSRNVFNPGVHRGLDGFRRFVDQIDEMWETFDLQVEEFVDGGDWVVTAVRIAGKGRSSGIEVEMHLFNVWTLRDGKVVRYEGGYRDRDEALKAAGPSE